MAPEKDGSPTPSTATSILRGLCPECHRGKITTGILGMKKTCPECGYDLHPENGYYLGAMMVGFFATAALTIPPVIALKVSGAEDTLVIAYPFLQFLLLGPLVTHYAKVAWAHIGHASGKKMERDDRKSKRP